jgi:hypothetical protein
VELGSAKDLFVVVMSDQGFDLGRENSVRTRRLLIHICASYMAVLYTALDHVHDLF